MTLTKAPNPFLDPAVASLATVIEALETAEPDPRRRGEIASGIRTVCKVLGHRPHELPADTALLNRLIRKAMPAAAGVSAIALGQFAEPAPGWPEAFRSRDHAGDGGCTPSRRPGRRSRRRCRAGTSGRCCRG